MENEKKLSKNTLKKVFYRHYATQAAFNPEKQQAIGYAYSMLPALRELYKDDSNKLQEAVKRHLAFFNCTCAAIPFILGITCAMEEQNANDKENKFDVSSINSVKLALMGPLAGIGDSFFWGTFLIMAVGIGAPLAIQGNILGVLIYILFNTIPSTLTRVYGFKIGYNGGNKFLSNMSKSGVFNKLTESAKIMGLVVIGSMVASVVDVNIATVLSFGGTEVAFQPIFDAICPKLLSLGLVFGCYKALEKKVPSTVVLFALIILSIVGVYFGVF